METQDIPAATYASKDPGRFVASTMSSLQTSSPSHSFHSSIPSPLITQIPHLTAAQTAKLPYPPDFFPGARDVSTSYGYMRVYEWGREQGRKIMLVHGDATSSPLWKLVAEDLVKRGNRVIVFDLWGRGYSSTPEVLHDGRLYGLQLLFAASSSPLPWCTETFTIVGFSLGGTIAMEFVASFPHLVRSVALLAPAGLIRKLPGVYEDLQLAVRNDRREMELNGLLAKALGVEEVAESASEEVLSRSDESSTGVDAAAIVRWQYQQHQGHRYSFASTLKCGLPQGQHKVWESACKVLEDKAKLRHGKEQLVVMCGSQDWVVVADHIREDLDGMIGREGYVFEIIEGGHGFLVDESACAKIVEVLVREWAL